jgi:branched-chain amino acid transport system substrate-binding protein
MGPRAAIAGLLAVLAAGPAACGGPPDPPVDPPITGPRLTVYSGQPLGGYEGDRARDVVDAERLALSEAGGRVGRWAIRYVALDDSDPRTGRWEPGVVAANARRATQDPTTIAYLGEMDSGASAVAVPVLNEEGILTVSPLDGLAGLTARRGAGQGEPDKYFPTRRRTFGRIVPGDDVQAAAVITYLQDRGARRLYLTHDDSLYGRRLALDVQRRAPAGGIVVVARRAVVPERVDRRPVAAELARTPIDAHLHAGQLRPGVARLMAVVHAASPRALLLGSSALAHRAFTSRLGAAGRSVTVMSAVLPAGVLPPGARAFERRFRATYGRSPDPSAVYAYEAMSVVLDCLRRAGPDANRRRAVVRAFFAIRARPSVLGTYDVDATGRSTIRSYGAYRVRSGRLAFERVLDPFGA